MVCCLCWWLGDTNASGPATRGRSTVKWILLPRATGEVLAESVDRNCDEISNAIGAYNELMLKTGCCRRGKLCRF